MALETAATVLEDSPGSVLSILVYFCYSGFGHFCINIPWQVTLQDISQFLFVLLILKSSSIVIINL